LNEGGTRLYSDLEVNELIDEISEAALEAIDKAAGEAAKAAVLSVMEREAIALKEAEKWRVQAELNAMEVKEVKKAGVRNTVIASVISLLSGFITGIIIMGVNK